MTSLNNDKPLYSGEFYEIHLSPDYKYNYSVVNTLTGVVEYREYTLPDAIAEMFRLDARLMEMLTEEDVVEIETNIAKSYSNETKEPF